MESINLTKELHMHLFTIYSCAAATGLDYLIADSPSYSKKAEILECEFFILSHGLLEFRIKSQNILKTEKDKNLFEKIIGNLFDNFLGDCLDIEEEYMYRTIEFLKIMPKRLNYYEELYFKNNPDFFVKKFYNLLFNELETLLVYKGDINKLNDVNIEIEELNIFTKLIRNIFYVVDLFFKDGITEYIGKELHPTEEFKKKSIDYLDKYFV